MVTVVQTGKDQLKAAEKTVSTNSRDGGRKDQWQAFVPRVRQKVAYLPAVLPCGMEASDSTAQLDNGTGEGYNNYSLDPALCGNVTPEYERVRNNS